MAPKKKSKKKQSKPKKAAVKKARKKPAAKKKVAPKKRKKTLRKKSPLAEKAQDVKSVSFRPEGLRSRSGGQSGDLQGLSSIAGADSESVDELLEEGNALEAEIVQGVQDAPDADVSEVRTHEVPEDDIPEEYQDQ
jgi:hypothetical protein